MRIKNARKSQLHELSFDLRTVADHLSLNIPAVPKPYGSPQQCWIKGMSC